MQTKPQPAFFSLPTRSGNLASNPWCGQTGHRGILFPWPFSLILAVQCEPSKSGEVPIHLVELQFHVSKLLETVWGRQMFEIKISLAFTPAQAGSTQYWFVSLLVPHNSYGSSVQRPRNVYCQDDHPPRRRCQCTFGPVVEEQESHTSWRESTSRSQGQARVPNQCTKILTRCQVGQS